MKHSISTPTNVLSQAQQYLLKLYNQKRDTRLVYHSYAQTMAVVDAVKTLTNALHAKPEIVEISSLAAYFYATGYLEMYGDAKRYSMELARRFLQGIKYDPQHIQSVVRAIEGAWGGQPTTAPSVILLDAVQATRYGEAFNEYSGLLRIELELVKGETYTKAQWQEQELTRLLEVLFYTPHGKAVFAPVVAQHIVKQKSRVEKQVTETSVVPVKNAKGDRPFQGLSLDGTNRGAQTFFRTNYRNHINLSAIADNKANIMISVNSILISVLITILTWRNITQTNPSVILPAVIFLVTALASLIFAILSARPKVTNLNKEVGDFQEIKRNITFFGNFVRLPLDQYEEAMDELLRDEELLYGNMSRDLYFLGKVLAKKYGFLTISYNIFMVGFVVSVLFFLVFSFV